MDIYDSLHVRCGLGGLTKNANRQLLELKKPYLRVAKCLC